MKYAVLLLLTSCVGMSAHEHHSHTGIGTSPSVSLPEQPQTPCDGGTSHCGGCKNQYKKPFQVCDAMLDQHVEDGSYTSLEIMRCYACVAKMMRILGISIEEAEKERVLANFTRMVEEEVHKSKQKCMYLQF